jgi:hypothetical protein
MEFSECRESTYFEPFFDLNLHNHIFFSRRSLRREGPLTSYSICGGICHVKLLVDDWPHREAFQPHACKLSLLNYSVILHLTFQSETFEYVRLDREYRYVSEQVSHHPPISACWAEGPRWRYYGEERTNYIT